MLVGVRLLVLGPGHENFETCGDLRKTDELLHEEPKTLAPQDELSGEGLHPTSKTVSDTMHSRAVKSCS